MRELIGVAILLLLAQSVGAEVLEIPTVKWIRIGLKGVEQEKCFKGVCAWEVVDIPLPNPQLKILSKQSDVLATCNEENTKCWTPCEQRMREAMKSQVRIETLRLQLDDFTHHSEKGYFFKHQSEWWALINEYQRLSTEWDQTMQECVR